MARKFTAACWLFAVLVSLLTNSALRADEPAGKPFLHPLFSDNAVLQRDIACPVWGWTEPGKNVTVSMEGKTATAVADASGKWLAKIGPFAAGGPYTLSVAGPTTVALKNVLVGDVWICSGQSNMEMGVAGVNNAQDEIKQADYPNIRLFTVPKKVAFQPQSVVESHWQLCTPANVADGGWGGFTAVGYFFGRHLHRELKVPIGLIHTSWGGTICEAWASGEALKAMPDFQSSVALVEQLATDQKQGSANFDQLMAQWYEKGDPGSANGLGWADPAHNVSAWKSMNLPQAWEQAGLPNFDGIVWFRKEIDIPAGWAGKDLTLHLGPIDDRDTTWFNGVKVGENDLWTTSRDYKVPGSAVKAGRNVIAVRVLDTGGNGGIYGKPEQLALEVAGDKQAVPLSLAGAWQYQDSTPLAKLPPAPQRANGGNPNVTTVLYNGMIAPLVPYGIKGAIWYQGESNADRGVQYRTLLPTMIKDWRNRFGVGEFPFFIVSLANFTDTKPEPGESHWAELREAQLLTALNLPKTGIAMAIDIGDAKDIHPKNKQEVGRRLGLAAQGIAYNQSIEYCGPLYRGMEVKGNAVRLAFDHLGGGLAAKGDKLQGFAISGDGKQFVWADAVIDGDAVVVSSSKVEKPVAVRYGWADNPVCNLYNKAGLPAPPFRTDSPK